MNSKIEAAKAPYEAPRLTRFGTVRNLTGGSFGPQGDMGGERTQLPSERHLKENIVKVGDHAAGFGLYLFDYKPEYRDTCGHGRQFGVMIDEVEAIAPDAISSSADGFKVVDYARLGITRH